jgi:hypothetical protein
MSQSTPESYNSDSHDSRGNVSQTVERFVDATEQLAAELDAPDSVVNEFVDASDELAGLVEETAQQVEDNGEELKETKTHAGKERAALAKRLSEIEDSTEDPDSADANHGGSTSETSLQDPETPLEDIVQLPEHVVSESLSANQQRSRFVAKDVNQYSRSVPAGRAIKSSELRRVLSARDDGSCHTQTVQRVMERLDDLGGDDVAIKETQEGEKVIVFTEEIVRRIQRYNDNHGVVSHQEAST